jgi:hypothetical protein
MFCDVSGKVMGGKGRLHKPIGKFRFFISQIQIASCATDMPQIPAKNYILTTDKTLKVPYKHI